MKFLLKITALFLLLYSTAMAALTAEQMAALRAKMPIVKAPPSPPPVITPPPPMTPVEIPVPSVTPIEMSAECKNGVCK